MEAGKILPFHFQGEEPCEVSKDSNWTQRQLPSLTAEWWENSLLICTSFLCRCQFTAVTAVSNLKDLFTNMLNCCHQSMDAKSRKKPVPGGAKESWPPPPVAMLPPPSAEAADEELEELFK